MYSRLNIKVLVIAFAILVVALIMGEVFNTNKERTFRKDILVFETSDITSIKIYALNDRSHLFQFKLDGNKWRVIDDSSSYLAEQSTVRNMLFLLRNADIERVVGTKEEDWKSYNLDDEDVLVVELNTDNDSEKLYLGGYHYVSGGESEKEKTVYANGAHYLSFMRIGDDKISYAVNGLIRPSFEKNTDDYRDKILLNGSVEQWGKLSFEYAAASVSNYVKDASGWKKNGAVCDSMAMVSYLRSLSKITGEQFYHGDISLLGDPLRSVEISGDGLTKPIKISCFGNDTLLVYQSSLRPDDYFWDKLSKIDKKIFKDKP